MSGQSLYPGAELMGPDEGVDFSKSVSGSYESGSSEAEHHLDLKVDVDRARPFSKALHCVSGTLILKAGKVKSLWSGNSAAAYFRSNKGSLVIEENCAKASLFVVLSDGGKREGQIEIKFKQARNRVRAAVTIVIENGTKVFEDVPRASQFFREVKIDIDYVETVIWPIIKLKDYKGTSCHMLSRELSIETAFEDAGLKLRYNADDSQKVVDPTPDTRWSKADMYAVMEDYFDHGNDNDENIWCLMATRPPDSRYVGFSFDKDGKNGFGLFTGHTSFNGIESDEKKVRAEATRRFLHYMVHECGHCLGLSHPFEIGSPNSLSWMNYAWKYDASNGPGKFYSKFKYSFSEQELHVLRHQPDKVFKDHYIAITGSPFIFSGVPKSDAPDVSSLSGDEEAELDGQVSKEVDHFLSFKIQFRSLPFPKGGVVELKASLRNLGILPCKIEPDLTLGGGNLSVFVTDPTGSVQVAKPFVNGIDSPTRQYLILGKQGSRDHSDLYSAIVPLIRGSRGAMFNKAGTYTVKAIYETGSLKVASEAASVVIVDDADNDEGTNDQMRVAASLGGSVSESTSKVIDYWKKLTAKPLEEKISRLQDIVILLQGLNKEVIKVTKASSKKRSKTRKLERSPALISARQLIEDTSDLVKYCRENWDDDSVDDQHFSKLILERAIILCKMGDSPTAEVECNQMIADLVTRDADFDFVKRVSNEWQKIRYPEKRTGEKELSYQQRVEKLIFWCPSDVAKGKLDKSGIGLGMPFNNFDDSQQQRSFRFAEDLEKIEEDTDDLDAVLDYAEGVLEGQEVNHLVYQWAIETYIVHSKLAKKNKVRYPEPREKNKAMLSKAAIIETKREGQPQEQWMNYWRCDGDFNYHHRHWHAVYRGGRRFQASKRQGELFGYMHAQLLTRYDAERESWGMAPVKAYEYEEVEPDGFDAGWEFHEDQNNSWFAPRPKKQVWKVAQRENGKTWEQQIVGCFDEGFLPEREFGVLKMDSNIAGHILESTTGTWMQEFGTMHNAGHMAFCNTVDIPRQKSTYMGSTLTAVRDPIFFRWHKRVDMLYQNWNNRIKEEVGADAPGIIIETSDALILPGTEIPKGFSEWSGNGWLHSNFKSDRINTYLREPIKAYEWDNKLDHEPFSYHIRMRRKPGTTGVLALTLRVFICQERHMNNREKWIEMDKFVHRLNESQDHSVIQRLDRESSVIKRIPGDPATSKETDFVTTVEGNCECGWPYRMMLPRGVHGGEKWVLGVIATDNVIDGIKVHTTCGSMSYCGTRDQVYPDQRTMGYPFSSNICIDKKVVSISEAARKLSNFCISPFEIHNDVAIKKPAVDPLVPTVVTPSEPRVVWAPYSIVGETGLGIYSSSRIKGRFRVLLKDEDFRLMGADRVRVHFKGRVDSSYAIYDVKIALRHGNTLDVDHRCNVDVLFKNKKLAEVPEEGLMSDELVLPVKPAQENDYFVTFSLTSPGCYVYVPQTNIANSYYVQSRNAELATKDDDWEKNKQFIKKRFRSLYCIECLQGTAAV